MIISTWSAVAWLEIVTWPAVTITIIIIIIVPAIVVVPIVTIVISGSCGAAQMLCKQDFLGGIVFSFVVLSE